MIRLGGMAFALAVCTTVAHADATWTYKMSSTGFRGTGASKGTQVRMIQKDRSRHEDQVEMTGAVLGKVSGPRQNVVLTLLDKQSLITLNVPKKTYEEISLKEIQKTTSESTPTSEPSSSTPDEPPTHRISRADFTVTPTKEQKTINGFPCTRYHLEMLLEVENLQTKEKSRTRMLNTLWTTPETGPIKQALQEEQAFSRAYLKLLGVEPKARDLADMSSAMVMLLTGTGERELKEVFERIPQEMKKVKGYPVVTQTEWFVKEEASASAPSAKATEEESSIDMSGGVSGALGGLASGWAKKKVAQKMDARQQARAGLPAFSVTSELQSISVDPIAPDRFQVPAGFKKASHP